MNNLMVKQKIFKKKTDLGQVCYDLNVGGRELSRLLAKEGFAISHTSVANHLNGEAIKVHELKWYHQVLQKIDHNVTLGLLCGNSVPKYPLQWEETADLPHLSTVNLIEQKPKAVLMFGHAEQKPNVKCILSCLLGNQYMHLKFFSTINNLNYDIGFAVILTNDLYAYHEFIIENDKKKQLVKTLNHVTGETTQRKYQKIYPTISMNFRSSDFEITDI